MSFVTRAADKAGLLGSIVSAMGCASCFPRSPVWAPPLVWAS
ncbi:hypothetical protein BX589_12697 [Paraburkholderia fungorum]|jgi:hypothetical protein|nr:putative merC [Burkholderia multivorans]PRZ49188.1 hypothetical protein BX589_12697 [Paraburkholderia fungorum]